MKLLTRLVCHAHEELINPKPVKLNARNVQTFPEELASQSDLELVQQVTAKNVVHLVNISTQTLDFVDHADMDSSNRTRDLSNVKFADLGKQRDRPKLSQELSAVMSVHQECNLELMVNVSHVREERIALKEFSQRVKLVRLEEQHLKLDQQLLKNVHCQFAHQELILTQQSMFASSAVKVSINPTLNKHHVFPAHQTTALRTLPPHQRLNAQILVKLPPKAANTAIQMLIAFLSPKLQTSNVNVNQDSMEPARLAWVRNIVSYF